jgi:hypothetical protein
MRLSQRGSAILVLARRLTAGADADADAANLLEGTRGFGSAPSGPEALES